MPGRYVLTAMRNLLQKNTALAIVIALPLLGFTAHSIFTQLQNLNSYSVLTPTSSYYYDLASQRLFVATAEGLPPIAGPGSRRNELTAPRAFVFACRSCADDKDRYIGWLQAYTPEAQDAFKQQNDSVQRDKLDMATIHQLARTVLRGEMIASPTRDRATEFVPLESPAGHKIMKESNKKCGEVPPRRCFP